MYVCVFYFFHHDSVKNTTKQNSMQFTRGSDKIKIATICL